MSIQQKLHNLISSSGIFVTRSKPGYGYIPKDTLHAHFERKLKRGSPSQLLQVDEFLTRANSVTQSGKTMLGYDRLYVLWQIIHNLRDGAMAEIGSYKGGSAYFAASAECYFHNKKIPFHVIDTFAGHPDKVDAKLDPYHQKGKFSDTDYETVKSYLSDFPSIVVHKNEFSACIAELPEQQYSFVHIDVDIYQTSMDCLNYFAPRLVPGGVMVLDDFDAPKCPGVNKAAEDFLESTSDFYFWHPMTEQFVLIKIG